MTPRPGIWSCPRLSIRYSPVSSVSRKTEIFTASPGRRTPTLRDRLSATIPARVVSCARATLADTATAEASASTTSFRAPSGDPIRISSDELNSDVRTSRDVEIGGMLRARRLGAHADAQRTREPGDRGVGERCPLDEWPRGSRAREWLTAMSIRVLAGALREPLGALTPDPGPARQLDQRVRPEL